MQNRLAALREVLAAQGLEALLVTSPDNRYYLSGFTARDDLPSESSGTLLITRDQALLFTDFRYLEWARAEARDFEVLVYQAGLGTVLAEQLGVNRIGRVGFETSYLTFGQYQRLTKVAEEAGPTVERVPTEGLVDGQREVKTPEEIDEMRLARPSPNGCWPRRADRSMPGMSERQVAWEIERRLREEGAEGLALPPIVAAGANGARPHHHPGEYQLKAQEPIIIDMGARVAGYCADLTRTVILGEPTARGLGKSTALCAGPRSKPRRGSRPAWTPWPDTPWPGRSSCWRALARPSDIPWATVWVWQCTRPRA